MHADVIEAAVLGPLEFHVKFADGLTGRVRFLPSHLYGVFEKLADPKFFERIAVTDGFVTWPGEIDLAPDAMYRAIRERGEWVLE
jgi:hypothetical protein